MKKWLEIFLGLWAFIIRTEFEDFIQSDDKNEVNAYAWNLCMMRCKKKKRSLFF